MSSLATSTCFVRLVALTVFLLNGQRLLLPPTQRISTLSPALTSRTRSVTKRVSDWRARLAMFQLIGVATLK